MFRKPISLIIIIAFVCTLITPAPKAQAQPASPTGGNLLSLPEPGAMVNLSPAYNPAMIKGVTVHKDNPFLFDFIVDVGQDKLQGEALKQEGEKLIKYFLANLAIPEENLWVNLSPYEKDRIIPKALSQTAMGRDLLAQDYMLKQITASLIYPEKGLGKEFWNRVYAKAGNVKIPVNTFNKVWIMADKAEIFERNQTAFVVGCHLKVMLEEDYLAAQKHLSARGGSASGGKVMLEEDYLALTKNTVGAGLAPAQNNRATARVAPTGTTSQIIRDIILPELEHEVNTGKNFANLRQIFNSIILSSWYKNNLKNALLNQVFANKEKTKGIDLNDPTVKEQIYERYLQAYKKGVFNFIKDDVRNGQTIPRKYFSGGMRGLRHEDLAMNTDPASVSVMIKQADPLITIATQIMPDRIAGKLNLDAAMNEATVAVAYDISPTIASLSIRILFNQTIQVNITYRDATVKKHPADVPNNEAELLFIWLEAKLRQKSFDELLQGMIRIPDAREKRIENLNAFFKAHTAVLTYLLASINAYPPDTNAQNEAMLGGKTYGGIDLKTSQVDWNLRKEGVGVEMNVSAGGGSAFGGDPAMLERIKREGIEGLNVEILRMTPMSTEGIWPLLGLQPPARRKE